MKWKKLSVKILSIICQPLGECKSNLLILRGVLGKFPDCIYYFNTNWQMLLEMLIPLNWYAVITIITCLWKINRINLLMVLAYRGIFSQNLHHKWKICLNKNVLKCIYLKLTRVQLTFLNYVVCALFLCVF